MADIGERGESDSTTNPFKLTHHTFCFLKWDYQIGAPMKRPDGHIFEKFEALVNRIDMAGEPSDRRNSGKSVGISLCQKPGAGCTKTDSRKIDSIAIDSILGSDLFEESVKPMIGRPSVIEGALRSHDDKRELSPAVNLVGDPIRIKSFEVCPSGSASMQVDDHGPLFCCIQVIVIWGVGYVLILNFFGVLVETVLEKSFVMNRTVRVPPDTLPMFSTIAIVLSGFFLAALKPVLMKSMSQSM